MNQRRPNGAPPATRRFILGTIVFCLFLASGLADESGNAAVLPNAAVASDDTADFVKEREKVQQAFWVERIEEETKWLTQTLALSPEQAAAVARLGKEAVTQALAEWSRAAALMADDFRREKNVFEEPPLKVLMDSWNTALASRVLGRYRPPMEQAGWREGLAALLTPAQAEGFKRQAPAHLAAAQKAVLKHVKEVQEDYREYAGMVLAEEISTLSRTFELGPEQEEKVQALAQRLVNRRLAEWRTEAARWLADQPPEGAGGLPEPSLPEPAPVTAHDARWIGGLRKILDQPAWRSLAGSLEAAAARRAKVLAQLLVMMVDEEVRCTGRQREQLLPLAERWVQAKPDLFQPQHRDVLARPAFLAAAARASAEELAGVLDPSQISAWRRVCVPGILDESGSLVLRPLRGQEQAGGPPAPALAGVDGESLLQAFLVDVQAKVRTRCLARAVGRAEEIGRICALTDEARTLLQTAARGAVEASLREWRPVAEGNTREQLEDVEERSVESLRTQLEQMDQTGAYDVVTPPEKQPVWTRTLRKVMQGLPSSQAAAWRHEETARAGFKRQAIVRFVLEDFHRVIYLTPEQVAKLQALLEPACKAHAEELEQRGAEGDAPWYLSKPENLSLLSFLPEAVIRPLLTAQQWSGWSTSEGYVEPEGKR